MGQKHKPKNKFNIVQSATKSPPIQYPITVQKPGYYSLYPYFSFRFYHKEHKKFTFEQFNLKDFKHFVQMMHKISQHRWSEIFTSLRSYFHIHEVDWDETSAKQGFAHLPPELRGYPVIQFELFEECRVFGFFNADNVFKIVWVDRNHEIYPARNR